MITLRRANERHHERRGKREVWHTFSSKDEASAFAEGFGILVLLDEHSLPPGASVPRQPAGDAELITYVHEGGLACEDSTGRSGIIQAGEFQRMNLARSFRFTKTNSSRAEWAHVFQLRLSRTEADSEARYEQKRFSAAERRGAFRAVATPDARKGSLTTAGALLYSAILSPGKHLVHELSTGQDAWLHVVIGAVTLGSVVLRAGDGAGVENERSISLTAREAAEILLCDLGACRPAGSPPIR
ncbi:MAG TPA: pirin family protein [Polyangiaceae bacterium]